MRKVLGSHVLSAPAYPQLLSLVASAQVHPERLITGIIGLGQAEAVLVAMGETSPTGITVVYPG